jgi:hypothetical protein
VLVSRSILGSETFRTRAPARTPARFDYEHHFVEHEREHVWKAKAGNDGFQRDIQFFVNSGSLAWMLNQSTTGVRPSEWGDAASSSLP